MTFREQLLSLQWAQLRHDQDYHRDVVVLPLAQRVKHMCLHYAKYTGNLLDAVESADVPSFEKALTDAFIIALATANALNQNVGADLIEPPNGSFEEAGQFFVESLRRDSSDPLWAMRGFARHNGRLAKACESWDHLESFPFRDVMRDCNVSILQIVMAEARARTLDLRAGYERRIRQIEARSMFDKHIRKGAGEM